MKKLLGLLVCWFCAIAWLSAADYTVVSSLVKGTAAESQDQTAGEAITAGQAVYRSASSTVKLATATNATMAAVFGVAMNSAALGQPIRVATKDTAFEPGITNMTAGQIVVLSSVHGAVCPSGDLSSGEYPTILGVALSATNMLLQIMKGSVAVP